MSLLNTLKEKHKFFEKEGTAFFNYADKSPKVNVKKALNFKKQKKVKKSFNSEGLRL